MGWGGDEGEGEVKVRLGVRVSEGGGECEGERRKGK